MKINKLQLNDFGKFSNKEILLAPNLNIIRGENESGKSTLQKFIISMMYGISKDKRKSNFTDYDKYLPWGKESFSGKISYNLDDGKYFEIYRDFSKKNPVVYNENLEDITNQYKKTTKGSSFFEEQTGVDEKTMLSSMITEQAEVAIDQASENFMIQKIANMTDTGDERISYDNSQKYLAKKRNEEVGTFKTKNRPINLLLEEKNKLLNKKEQIEKYSDEQYEIEKKIKITTKNKADNEELLQFALKYKEILDEESEQRNRIEVYKENINNNENDKNKLKEEQKKLEEELKQSENEFNMLLNEREKTEENKNNTIKKLEEKKNKENKTLISLTAVLSLALLILLLIGQRIAGLVLLGFITLTVFLNRKKVNKINTEIKNTIDHKNDYEDTDEEYRTIIEQKQNSIKEIKLKIDVLNSSNTEANKQIKTLQETINETEKNNTLELLREFKNLPEEEYLEIINSNNIISKISYLQNNKNNISLELQKYEYTKNSIVHELEKIATIEEELCSISEREAELNENAEAILKASQILEKAYEEMKKNIVPKFTKTLSSTISTISNGKYKQAVTNDKEGLLIEKEDGQYIPAKALSMGTIDQLYLSLRLTIAEKVSDEKLPIILDEAFAYYDNKRLANILQYLASEFRQYQILLFTCTNRETDILDELKIAYNLVEL